MWVKPVNLHYGGLQSMIKHSFLANDDLSTCFFYNLRNLVKHCLIILFVCCTKNRCRLRAKVAQD